MLVSNSSSLECYLTELAGLHIAHLPGNKKWSFAYLYFWLFGEHVLPFTARRLKIFTVNVRRDLQQAYVMIHKLFHASCLQDLDFATSSKNSQMTETDHIFGKQTETLNSNEVSLTKEVEQKGFFHEPQLNANYWKTWEKKNKNKQKKKEQTSYPKHHDAPESHRSWGSRSATFPGLGTTQLLNASLDTPWISLIPYTGKC